MSTNTAAALRSIIELIRGNAGCAALFADRVNDRIPGDLLREAVNVNLPEHELRCWFGPMRATFGNECSGHKAEMRIYVEGNTQSRAPVWDAAFVLVLALRGAQHANFGTITILRPIADVLEMGSLTSVAVDIGFTIPWQE